MKRRLLVLCTGNSARSQMAEAIINGRRGDAWDAVSAGTHPAARVHPAALDVLAEIGLRPAGAFPKHADTLKGDRFDLVLTVCDDAAENCPVWVGPGQRVHLSFPDPARATGSDDEVRAVFRDVRDDIERRVLDFLDTLSSSPEGGT